MMMMMTKLSSGATSRCSYYSTIRPWLLQYRVSHTTCRACVTFPDLVVSAPLRCQEPMLTVTRSMKCGAWHRPDCVRGGLDDDGSPGVVGVNFPSPVYTKSHHSTSPLLYSTPAAVCPSIQQSVNFWLSRSRVEGSSSSCSCSPPSHARSLAPFLPVAINCRQSPQPQKEDRRIFSFQ